MFTESERKVFRYEVGGAERFADPLDVRRQLLRHSAGKFWTWLDESHEPDDREAAPPLPTVAPEASDAEAQAQQKAIAEAHAASRLMASLHAQEQVMLAVRAVFDLPPVDRETGAGYPEADCWRVIDQFWDWLEKNASGGGN